MAVLALVVSSSCCCFFLFLLLQPWRAAAAIGSVCGNAGNYTANGTYQSNLGSLCRTLPGKTSSSTQLFATATAGRAPDAVYALALCRGHGRHLHRLQGLRRGHVPVRAAGLPQRQGRRRVDRKSVV